MHAYIHTYIHTYINTCMNAYIHAYMHLYVHTFILNAYKRTCMYAYIHAYASTNKNKNIHKIHTNTYPPSEIHPIAHHIHIPYIHIHTRMPRDHASTRSVTIKVISAARYTTHFHTCIHKHTSHRNHSPPQAVTNHRDCNNNISTQNIARMHIHKHPHTSFRNQSAPSAAVNHRNCNNNISARNTTHSRTTRTRRLLDGRQRVSAPTDVTRPTFQGHNLHIDADQRAFRGARGTQ
jgi:hypothetical protein